MKEGCSFEDFCVQLAAVRYRFPTKTNLYRIGIITSEAQMCIAGCSFQELENHLFFCLVLCLVKFDSLFGTGFVFTQQIHIILLIIFINLVIAQVVPNLGAPSCIWSSLLVFWCCRRK